MAPITLRLPSTSSAAPPATQSTLSPPPLSFLLTTWHVTHSTLPMWRKARNVRITYKQLSEPTSASTTSDTSPTTTAGAASTSEPTSARLDDLVTYQSLTGAKVKSVHGVDTPSSNTPSEKGWAYNWRGKGWLVIASSHWEVLGYGDDGEGEGEEGNKYVVTYFAKTLFTPAGIDFYSRDGKGLREETVEGIKKALEELGDEELKKLAEQLFEVKIDGERGAE